jgi:hypothetical protein
MSSLIELHPQSKNPRLMPCLCLMICMSYVALSHASSPISQQHLVFIDLATQHSTSSLHPQTNQLFTPQDGWR